MDQASQRQPDALSAGRRIYLGNLPYRAKPHDVEEILATNGFDDIENIHISVDPVSGRNPGYCFVDFHDRATADRAISSLRASIDGRPIKVGPCEPKKQNDRHMNRKGDFAFNRWGDWNSQSTANDVTIGRLDGRGTDQGPYGALDHFDDMLENYDGRRLYVGGLGKMINQVQHNRQINEIFAGFSPTAIGKRITPHESTRLKPGNHHYCFVDFKTREEANSAMKALNGRSVTGGRLKVSLAGHIPKKLVNRQTGASSGSGNMTESNRAIASSDWRRRDNE